MIKAISAWCTSANFCPYVIKTIFCRFGKRLLLCQLSTYSNTCQPFALRRRDVLLLSALYQQFCILHISISLKTARILYCHWMWHMVVVSSLRILGQREDHCIIFTHCCFIHWDSEWVYFYLFCPCTGNNCCQSLSVSFSTHKKNLKGTNATFPLIGL